MKRFYRIRLGRKNIFAEQCLREGFVGVDFDVKDDLTEKLYNDVREFKDEYIPVFSDRHPDKKKVAASLVCGEIWTATKGIQIGDVVISPGNNGRYHFGEVIGQYSYVPDKILPHRRAVRWLNDIPDLAGFTDSLRNNLVAPGTVREVTDYHAEIEPLISGDAGGGISVKDKTIEDPIVFALEKHLEDFLVKNWAATPLGQDYDLYEVDDEMVGQQFPTDTGTIDILAISKDRKTLLVVELKKGRASDRVVGQIQRYMGYVLEELAESGQNVKGTIIALEDDIRIRRSLAVAPNIDFYRYQVSFTLQKV